MTGFENVCWKQSPPLEIILTLLMTKLDSVFTLILALNSVWFFFTMEKILSLSALEWGIDNTDFIKMDSRGYLISPTAFLILAMAPHCLLTSFSSMMAESMSSVLYLNKEKKTKKKTLQIWKGSWWWIILINTMKYY